MLAKGKHQFCHYKSTKKINIKNLFYKYLHKESQGVRSKSLNVKKVLNI